jgi:hypothetical protein
MPQIPLNFPLDGRLVEQRERNLGVLVPIPLSERVEALTEMLYREGHGKVPRKDVVGALLFAATENADELVRLLRVYRTARVQDALVGQIPADDNVVSFPSRAPGPRARLS